MSNMEHAVLISSYNARSGGRLRNPQPQFVACLWVGHNSAHWVFTPLWQGWEGGTVAPRGFDDVASALLVGIAVHVLGDKTLGAVWQLRKGSDFGDSELSVKEDGPLVLAAQEEVIGSGCRLTVIHDASESDSTGFIESLGEISGLNYMVMVPPAEEAVVGLQAG